MGKMSVVLVLVVGLFLSIARGETRQTTNDIPVDLYTGPNAFSQVTASLSKQSVVELLGENPNTGFVFVRTQNGKTGWLRSEYVRTDMRSKAIQADQITPLDKLYLAGENVLASTQQLYGMLVQLIYKIESMHVMWALSILGMLLSGIWIGLVMGKKQPSFKLMRG